MKADELLKHAKCSACENPIGHTRIPLFWVVTVQRHGLDLGAIQRHDGLAMMLNSNQLAQIMGPDEEMTLPVTEPVTLTLCETCMIEKFPLLADLTLRE